ncbi:torso-like protein isoform X2 [Homarus americanus]|uniref:torso-like protein isoform X2 n=1 Tax=Homarus americanus TaxID=6706 RepID=UPI001C48C299|nr:torso-like protein isoform X2 [Homarus americanus]
MEATSSSVCDLVRSHLSACDSVMGVGVGTSWAALILAVCVLCGESKNSTTRDADEDNDIITSSDYLKVGRSLNLLPRYGFLTLSIKVFPHRYDNSWLFRDKTAEVFQKNSYWASQTKRRNQQHQVTQTDRHGYDQHFLIDFCDDVRDLLTAYFDNFYIEGVPEPHRVFITSLATKTKAQHLGIHPTFLSTEYSFVLVRLFRRNRRSTLDGRLTLTPNFKSAVNDIRIGSSESVNQFLDLYGTHVITEYEVGDIMYQVYVFGERTYGELKNNFAMSQSSQSELIRMEHYFTPYYALHAGRVKLASGNDQFEDMVGNQLTSITYFRLYQSIFSIFKNQELEKKLEELEGEVVLSLKLEKITKIVPKSPERRWLGEVLDNTLSLYYVTM